MYLKQQKASDFPKPVTFMPLLSSGITKSIKRFMCAYNKFSHIYLSKNWHGKMPGSSHPTVRAGGPAQLTRTYGQHDVFVIVW